MSDAKDVLGLVPEAYFDLIARMVPGIIAVIVIAIEPSIINSLVSCEKAVGKTGIVLIILLFSYAVGLALDVTGELMSDIVIFIINIFISSDKIEIGLLVRNRLNSLKPDDARIIIKMMAERVVFRSLFLLVILTEFLSPSLFPTGKLALFAKWILPFTFIFAFIHMEYSARKRMDSLLNEKHQYGRKIQEKINPSESDSYFLSFRS